MAEFDDKALNNLASEIGNLSEQFSGIGGKLIGFNTNINGLAAAMGKQIAKAFADSPANAAAVTAAREVAPERLKKIGELLRRYEGRIADVGVEGLNIDEIHEVTKHLGSAYADLAREAQAEADRLGDSGLSTSPITQRLQQQLIKRIEEEETALHYREQFGNQSARDDFNNQYEQQAMQLNRFGQVMIGTEERLEIFNSVINSNMIKSLMLGEALMQAGGALLAFRNKIYDLQAKLGTTFATSLDKMVGSYAQVVASYFREGPALTADDTINAINAFQKEFGTILTTGEAGKLAQQAKAFGTGAEVYFKAQRAFLGAGGIAGAAVTQQKFITQFRAAGLTANQALTFAANSANLVAIAGVKYADSLARAAANATKIGVSLNNTEAFADNFVSDFEGALERMSELSALGFDLDFSKLAKAAGTGTPEEVQQELSRQFGGNQQLLKELQSNRFLKVALERDLGLDIAEITRLAMGGAGTPAAQTAQEKNEESLTSISKYLPLIVSAIGALITVMALQSGGGLGKVIGGVVGSIGGPMGALIGSIMGGAAGAMLAGRVLPGKAYGGMITGPGTATSDNILTPTSPGEFVVNAKATSAYGADMLSSINRGTFAPQQSNVNNVVNVDMSKLESKLDRLASAFSGMKIEMDGNTVGRVSLNARSPIDRLAVVG